MSSLSSSPVHLLSKKSRKLHRDTFFFVPHFGGPLLGGLNQRLTPVTNAKLNRWVRMLEPDGDDFELQPITMTKTIGVLSYKKVPAGSSIPAYSTAPLAPGDYAWELMDTGPYLMPCTSVGDESTFAELKRGAEQPGPLEHLAEFLPWYQMPGSLNQSVTARDGRRCLMTGSSSNDTEIGLSWIFPPAWAKWVCLDLPQYYDNPPAISNPSNAMLMREDLIAVFHNNAFGIDVDDDYRLVIFSDVGPAQDLLTGSNSQAYFRRPGSKIHFTGPDDYFLREHFKHCLRVHLLRGDIGEDYSQNAVRSALSEILECHLLSQFERSDYESQSEDDD